MEERYSERNHFEEKTIDTAAMKKAYKRHEKKCNAMFENAFKGSKLYIHVDEIDIERKMIRFGILTDEMISYDSEMEGIEGYRPYFFSFRAEYNKAIEELVKQSDAEFNEKQRNYELKAALIGYRYEDRWMRATFDEESAEEPILVIEGDAETAASPLITHASSLKIIDTRIPPHILDRINKTYAVAPQTDHDVKRELNRVFENLSFDYAHIFRSGHSNFIKLLGRNRGKYASVVFDIGKHGGFPGSAAKDYPKANAVIRRMRPTAVFLSHWDLDHILGVIDAGYIVFERPWFAPEIESGSLSARRLACYLRHKNRITLIARNAIDCRIDDICGLSIYMGQNKTIKSPPHPDISKENSGGIVLVYERNEVKTIFCGDAPYEALPIIWDDSQVFDYIVIPHHARSMEVDGYVASNETGGYAIYCRDDNGDTTHLDELRKRHYEILKTEDVTNTSYRINLTRHERPTDL